MQKFRGDHLLHKPSFFFEVGKAIADVCGLLSLDQPVCYFQFSIVFEGLKWYVLLFTLYSFMHISLIPYITAPRYSEIASSY